MRKLILSIALCFATAMVSAQSELGTDSIHGISMENYKNFDGFLLDMGMMVVAPPPLTAPHFDFRDYGTTKDYQKLFQINPDIIYGQEFITSSLPFYSGGMGFFGFGSMPMTLQKGSFKLKNGMRINTYGEYDADGNKVYNPSALPWEKNNFNGAFEVKSANGNFGIRIEVQQGRRVPY